MADSFGQLTASTRFRLLGKGTIMSLATLSVPKNTSTWKLPTLQNLFPLLPQAAVVESRPRNRDC